MVSRKALGVSVEERRQRECRIIVEGTMIGTSTLFNADPPMGVAMGVFVPSEAYRPERHAHERAGGMKEPLPCAVAQFDAGETTLSLKFFLMDFADLLPDDDARELHVYFPNWETYEAFFAG